MSSLKPLKTPKLPKKPSGLIRAALADLIAVEKLKSKYVIDMYNYHQNSDDDKCAVCFAGATIARANPDKNDQPIEPMDFDQKTKGKLYALDRFRSGEVHDGLLQMDIDPEAYKFVPSEVPSVSYLDDKKQFKKDMESLAALLESQGL